MASADLAVQAAIYAALIGSSDILAKISADGTSAKARVLDEAPSADDTRLPFISLGESRLEPRRYGNEYYGFDVTSTVSVFSRPSVAGTHQGSIDGKSIAELVRTEIGVDGALSATGWRVDANRWTSTDTVRLEDGITYRTDVVIRTSVHSET